MVFVGAIWLVVLSIQTGKSTGDKALWAIVNFVCQPIGGIAFFIVKKAGLVPLLMVIAGCILTGFGYATLIPEIMKNLPK